MSITVTPKAAAEILRVLKEQQLDSTETVLRVGIEGGGYAMSFDKKDTVNPLGDIIYNFDGLAVVVERRASRQLEETTVDFYEDDSRRGFLFNAPPSPLQVGMSSCSSATQGGGCGGCSGGCG